MKTKTCPDCKEDKPHSEYYVARARKDGVATYCKPCANVRNDKSKKMRDLFRAGIKTAEVVITTPALYEKSIHNFVYKFKPRDVVRWVR